MSICISPIQQLNFKSKKTLRTYTYIVKNKSMLALNKLSSRFSIMHHSHLSKEMVKLVKEYKPEKQYPGFTPIIKNHGHAHPKLIHDRTHNLNFLVEESGFPACTDLGICINLGTRDEDYTTAGSLAYLKNYVHIKPTLEQTLKYYDFYQQSGAHFGFEYDHQYTYIKSSFFSEDIEIMSDLLLDLALKDKRMYQENQQMDTHEAEILNLVRGTAFQHKGLGMPRSGVGNILTTQKFLKFQKLITPHNTLFSIAGYPEPERLIKMLTDKISKHHPEFLSRPKVPRTLSPYKGGYKKYVNPEADMFQFAIAFQSFPLHSPHMEMMNILRVLMGNASSFSSGGPGKGMHSRCTINLLNAVRCVEKASCINQHYNDTGLFGLSVGGPCETHKEVIQCTVDQLKKLKSLISHEQLEKSKNILMQSVYTNIERQCDRLEEMSKHVFSYGRIRLFEFEQNVRKVTSQQIKDTITHMLETKPTIVCSGDQSSTDKCYSQAKVIELLRKR